MQQVEIRTVVQALTRSNQAIEGATLHGAALGITRNTAAAITLDRSALTTALNAYEAGKLGLGKKRDLRDVKLLEVRAFVRIARDMLRPHLGNQHGPAWTAAGFIGTLVIPMKAGKLVVLLETMAAYLTANPSAENAGLNITADQAETLRDELLAADSAVNNQGVTVSDLLDARETKFRAMHKRVGDLFKELAQIMSPVDNRWTAFGFNVPGAEQTPDQPANLRLTFKEAGKLQVAWDRAARSKYYRVWKKVVGSDEEYSQVDNPKDLALTIEGLPAGVEVEIVVAACNSGGESPRSEVLKVTTV